MTFEVDDEDVFPGLALHGPGLHGGQIHTVPSEGAEKVMQRTGLIASHSKYRASQILA